VSNDRENLLFVFARFFKFCLLVLLSPLKSPDFFMSSVMERFFPRFQKSMWIVACARNTSHIAVRRMNLFEIVKKAVNKTL
jgi:hypothetical protein